MKNLLKKMVLFILKRLARHRMKKFKGKVVVVTGTIGKTSTKEAIFTVLNSRFKILKNKGNMNSDFGLPLTILEIDSGNSSALKWSWLLIKGFFHSITKNYNEIVLLELGVDKPKDMDFLMSIVRPDIAVLTNITPGHMGEGQFKSLEEIFTEKRKAVDYLNKNGIAVLSHDNEFLQALYKERKGKNTVTYGQKEGAQYRATKIYQDLSGVNFTLQKEEDGKKKNYEIHTEILGAFQANVLVPAIICGELLGMTTEEAIAALKRYKLPPGRMNVIAGLNGATILDSSYNSSPESLQAALELLAEVGKGKRKIAALGAMNELGENSQLLHEKIGETVPSFCDVLLTVGKEAEYFAEKAKEKGMNPDNIFSFKNSTEAAAFLKDKLDSSDLILAKGSQNNIRMERFVKALMAFPEDAKTQLVRQSKEWTEKL